MGAPGVSDIDIILVFKNDPGNISKYDFEGINENVYDLVANGNVIKMCKSTFANLNYKRDTCTFLIQRLSIVVGHRATQQTLC